MAEMTVLSDRIVTELSLDEARALAILCDFVGGDPKNSPRKYVDSIGDALREVGIQTRAYKTTHGHRKQVIDGGVYFSEVDDWWETYTNQ